MTNRNKTAFLNEIEGFATFKFAEKRALEVSKDQDDAFTFFIFPNDKGRFVPVFIYNETAPMNMPYIASKGCAVMN
jgi:hypothetical protein